jgi:glycosyltransferase involved in cell wall biosynthesis
MRIAMVSEHASPRAVLGGVDAGGQNVHVHALASQLVDRGHDVVVYTRRDAPDLPSRVRCPGGYTVEHVPAGPASDVPKDEMWQWMPDFSRYLASRWAQERFDVVHAHFWMSGAAATWASLALPRRLPVVQTFHALGSVKRRHQGDRDTSPEERIDVESRLCRAVDHVVATCSDEVTELEELGLDPSRATVIPCGVDTTLFRPAPPRDGDRTHLLAVARLVERKGIADVIRALPALPDATLSVVGGPARDSLALDPEARRLARIAREVGCQDRVDLVGRVAPEQMPEAIADSDIVVATPWYEPFGMVPLEAMACGRPVIGSAVGGLLDTVVPEETGELVPPRRPDLIAEAVGRMPPERRAEYGAAGVERVESEYTWRLVAERTEQVFRRVTAEERQMTGVIS